MEKYISILQAIAEGSSCSNSHVLIDVLTDVNERCSRTDGIVQLQSSSHVVVVGPLRGHATAAARVLCAHLLADSTAMDASSKTLLQDGTGVVFLGGLIDGGPQSVVCVVLAAVVWLLLGPARVAVLQGPHEASFPQPYDDVGGCLLSSMLRDPRETEMISKFFRQLPVACCLYRTYFCVGSGIPSSSRTLMELEQQWQADPVATARDMVFHRPMDEDDEQQHAALPSAPSSRTVQFASTPRGTLLFSHNAVCNFLDRNKLTCLIRGEIFAADRRSKVRNSRGRQVHTKFSSYDPGYHLHALHPRTRCPAVLSLFSSPTFLGTNRNVGAVAIVRPNGIGLQQFEASDKRQDGYEHCMPPSIGGPLANGIAMTFPALVHHTREAIRGILFGCVVDDSTIDALAVGCDEREGALQRAKYLAQLLLKSGHCLPTLELQDAHREPTQ